MRRIASLVFLCCWASAAQAADPSPTPTPTPTTEINLYLDAYYTVNFNSPPLPPPNAQGFIPSQNGSYRNFDIHSNALSLALGELSVTRKEENFGIRGDIDFGDANELMHQGGPAYPDNVTKHLGQLFLTYTPSAVRGLTVTAGKMYSHMGWETVKAVDNWQYSRSALFTVAIPYWAMGLGVRYDPSPKASAALFLYNGWNNVYENNTAKTLGAQGVWKPTDEVSLTYNLVAGAELPGSGGFRTVNELIAAWSVNPKLSLAMDTLIGTGTQDQLATGIGDGSWRALVLAFKYQVAPSYYVSPRFEVYADTDGITTGTAQAIHDVALTQALQLKPHFGLRAEVRWDGSTAAVYPSKDVTRQNQTTITFGFLASL